MDRRFGARSLFALILAATPLYLSAQPFPAPVLTSIQPTSRPAGAATVSASLFGANFNPGRDLTVLSDSGGVKIGIVVIVSQTELAAEFIVAAGFTGIANMRVRSQDGTSEAHTFTVIAPTPTLTSITPSSGTASTTVAVTLTGTNFAANSGISVSNPGITASVVSQPNSTTINANFVIAANAARGPLPVVVTDPTLAASRSNSLNFTVTDAAVRPTISSISPTTFEAGKSSMVVVQGANFTTQTTLEAAGASSVVFSNITVISSTQLSAFVNSPAGTSGRFLLTAANSGLASTPPTPFLIAPLPTLTSVTPKGGPIGIGVPVTVKGTNFTSFTTFETALHGLAFTDVVVVDAMTITATATVVNSINEIGFSAVTGGSLRSNQLFFTGRKPVITSILPSSGLAGTTTPVQLKGQDFGPGTTFTALSTQQAASLTQVTYVNSTTFTASVVIKAGAGAETVQIQSSGDNSQGFTIIPSGTSPTLTSILPNTGAAGTSFNVTFTGTNFGGSVSLVSSNTGVQVTNAQLVSATQATATLSIAPSATGIVFLTLTTPGGTSGAVAFTITPAAAPTLTSMIPNTAAAGTTGSFLISGTNLGSNTTLASSSANLKFANVAMSATTITGDFAVLAGASPGPVNITVSNSGQSSNALVFTITAGAGPSLTSITPSSGLPGTSVNVTLAGASFAINSNIVSSLAGVTVSNLALLSPTTMTATLTIAANASGIAMITVVNGGVASNALAFTIGSPTILTISHVADGAGWSTAIILVNTDVVPAPYTVQFTGDSGSPFAPSLAGFGKASSVTGTIPVGGSTTIATDGTTPGLSEGWARITSSQAVNGTAVFRLAQAPGSAVPFQEAAVPLLAAGNTTVLFPFDNNPGFATGFALSAPDNAGVTNITRRQRSQSGQDITSSFDSMNSAGVVGDCVTLAARGHCADLLHVNSTAPENLRGVAQFDSTGGPIFGLGIRAFGGAFTSIEAVTKQPAATKVITHIADGGTVGAVGGWKTTIILVNTDTVQASFTVNFWRDNGTPFVVQLAGGSAVASLSGVIPVGGTFTIETADVAALVSTGWAEVLSNQSLGGTAVFRLESSGQEAAVPFGTAGGTKLLLPFSSGAGFALAIALANASTTADATLTYSLRNESGQPLKDASGKDLTNIPVPWGDGTGDGVLLKHQHKSLVLNIPLTGAGENRGVVEFNSTGGPVFAIGIRANNGAFTSVRVLGK